MLGPLGQGALVKLVATEASPGPADPGISQPPAWPAARETLSAGPRWQAQTRIGPKQDHRLGKAAARYAVTARGGGPASTGTPLTQSSSRHRRRNSCSRRRAAPQGRRGCAAWRLRQPVQARNLAWLWQQKAQEWRRQACHPVRRVRASHRPLNSHAPRDARVCARAVPPTATGARAATPFSFPQRTLSLRRPTRRSEEGGAGRWGGRPCAPTPPPPPRRSRTG